MNNTTQKVVVKQSKRKDVYWVLKAKLSFKYADHTGTGICPDTPMFFNQNLCWYYKFFWFEFKKPLLNKVIEMFWVSKGSCRIRLVDKSVKVITHIDELNILFPINPILKENLLLWDLCIGNAIFENIPASCQTPVALKQSVFSKSKMIREWLSSNVNLIIWFFLLVFSIFSAYFQFSSDDAASLVINELYIEVFNISKY